MDQDADVPTPAVNWSETRFFACFDHEVGAGMFVHAGRCLDQPDLWWVHLTAYLPDGRLAVERVFGRPLPVSTTNANGNLIGVDHTREDPVVFAECPIRATASDGSVGCGHLERSARREALLPSYRSGYPSASEIRSDPQKR